MSEIERLDSLAARINAEHRACETAVNVALEHALNAGDLLLKAKSQCLHGTWLSWLEENFKGSVRTAQTYIRVAARRDEVEAALSKRDSAYEEALRISAEVVAEGHKLLERDDLTLEECKRMVDVTGRIQGGWTQMHLRYVSLLAEFVREAETR